MSHQFKPGDLALIVGANVQTQNIGKVCELVQMVVRDEIYTGPDGHRYQHADGPCWLTSAPELVVHFDDGSTKTGWGLSFLHHLMPLKGDEQPVQVRQAERVQ